MHAHHISASTSKILSRHNILRSTKSSYLPRSRRERSPPLNEHSRIVWNKFRKVQRFLVVEPTHQDSSPCRIFLDLFQAFRRCPFSGRKCSRWLQRRFVASSSISRCYVGSYLGGAHRNRVCVYFIVHDNTRLMYIIKDKSTSCRGYDPDNEY